MSKHISEAYDVDLTTAKNLLMEMGGLVEQQLRRASHALVTRDLQIAYQVQESEGRVNDLEVELDEQCVQVIARRQPAASDLRGVISIMKTSTDLERIGDEAERIAKMAISNAQMEMPADHFSGIRSLSESVSEMVRNALDAFARQDVKQAEAIFSADETVDESYVDVVHHLILEIQQHPEHVERNMNTVWAARALERIGDHAKNICEYVIYQVEGEDVRHRDSK